MSTDNQYTPDELAFLDKALVGIANGYTTDPDISWINTDNVAKEALALLEARRKILGPAKVLDEAGARRLERLDPFYAAASRLVGLLGDADAMYTNQVLAHLDSHVATMKDRGLRLTNMSLENDSLKTRVKELEAKLATAVNAKANVASESQVIRSIRSRFEAIASGTIGDTARINYALVFKVIDEAIAELAPIANDEPICNENVIRGAYFWSGHVSSPVDNLALMNKSTMTFTSIAKQLKLETSDIVEIRVIERADR